MRRHLLAAAVIAGTMLLGCGGDEAAFSAEEFVVQANEHGASLALGRELQSTREGVELHSVEIEGPGAGGAAQLEAGGHAGATLTVTESEEAGEAEHERCERAASLLCYRAANVVLFFEDALRRGDQDRIAQALRMMASEEGP